MNDVATVRSENASIKKIRDKLLQWEVNDCPLAPLLNDQQDTLSFLEQISEQSERQVKHSQQENDLKGYNVNHTFLELHRGKNLDTTHDFLSWYDHVESKIFDHAHQRYLKYLEQLQARNLECDKILNEIKTSLLKLDELTYEYEFVSNKTSSLNLASEKLIEEQVKLNDISKDVHNRLINFTQSELLHQRLSSPTMSVASDSFRQCLDQIDNCLEYLTNNVKYKESPAYIIKYKHCLTKSITLMRNYVTGTLSKTCEQIHSPTLSSSLSEKTGSETAFALYYGKFQPAAAKIKRISEIIEERVTKNHEYQQLLLDLHSSYLSERASVMSPAVKKAISDLKNCHKGDHCSLIRSSCAFLVHVCQDEYRLFYQFFSTFSEELHSYLEGICTILYDALRPFIIHVNHLETLAEICSILKIEMLDEHVQQSPDSLQAFAKITFQLLQDVQERLVFRAHLYLHSDILNYKPSAGDLAYPEKLEMMESIALSLQEPLLKRSESKMSVSSSGTLDSVTIENYQLKSTSSPADLHGMWYPTVRRTLVCLSRLYRCVDRPIFQGLSQEALKHCIESIVTASIQISAHKSPIDGELFQIKHLLILREQIAPFRVDFTVKETSLDFSKIKTAAFGLLQKRKQLFSLGTNNAFLEFLLEGTPQVREHLLDSRKDVDRQLKTICEQFIKDSVQMLIGPVLNFLEKAQELLNNSKNNNDNTKINFTLRQSPWASPQQLSSLIQESQRLIKKKLSGLQRSMQLYLSNKDTEFIIFRPIRNNIIGTFVKLEQVLTSSGYTANDMIITACPSAEQVSILLSSASILADKDSTTLRNRVSPIEAHTQYPETSLSFSISKENSSQIE